MALTGTHMPGDAGATTDDNLRDLAILDRIPRWAPTTVYDINAQVISPNNDVVKANVGHTSAAAYATDVAKWTLSTTFITTAAAATLIATQHTTDDSVYAPIGAAAILIAAQHTTDDSVYAPIGATISAFATGITNFVFGGGNTLNVVVTFPAGRFSAAPVVVAMIGATAYRAVTVRQNVAPTTTGVTLTVSTTDSTAMSATIPVHWIAIQE